MVTKRKWLACNVCFLFGFWDQMGEKMLNVQWDKKFDIGNEKIDSEHKIFFGLIQDYTNEVSSSRSVARIRRILNELKKYAEFHFISEQNLMIEINYPALLHHINLHSALLFRLEDFYHDLAVGEVTYESFALFLFEWFTLHTTIEDKKIAEFISKNHGAT